MERKHDIFTIVPSHHRIRGTPCTCLTRISPLPPGTLTRHKEQYVQTSRSCKTMYKATCSSQAPLALQLQVAVEFWSYHSGRTLIRLGRANSGSLSISASRLPPSPCRTPGYGAQVLQLDTRELDTFNDTSVVRPVNRCNYWNENNVLINAHGENNEIVPPRSALGFCPWGFHFEIGWVTSGLSKSLMFFTPASVINPPQTSRDWRFLKTETAVQCLKCSEIPYLQMERNPLT